MLPILPRLAAVLTGLATIVAGPTTGTARADQHLLTTTGVTPGQVALLEWAVDLFDAADLELPPIEVVGHDTTEACSGRAGAHVFANGRSTIHLCTHEAGRIQEFLVVHELAHAWDQHVLSDERRQAFLALRGLTEWRNNDLERWHERGAEHAAEIMMWGLMDRPVLIIRIPGTSCAELLAGYVTLVGRAPLHGFTDHCTG